MTQSLETVAQALVAPGKGILAADESSGTIKKRFDAIGVENTESNRRDYREMLFRCTEAMRNYISGVILYDETIRQKAKDGTPLVQIIAETRRLYAVGRVIVSGGSMGGTSALAFAALHPELVDGVVAMNGTRITQTMVLTITRTMSSWVKSHP